MSAPSTFTRPRSCESHPVQEVFLPSWWAATEMKISHLNFFAFASLPSVTARLLLAAGGTELGIQDNSNATLCHPALISDDGTLVFFARPLYQGCHLAFFGKGVVLPSSIFFLFLFRVANCFILTCTVK